MYSYGLRNTYLVVAQHAPPTPVYNISPTKCQEYVAETQADMEQTLYTYAEPLDGQRDEDGMLVRKRNLE